MQRASFVEPWAGRSPGRSLSWLFDGQGDLETQDCRRESELTINTPSPDVPVPIVLKNIVFVHVVSYT